MSNNLAVIEGDIFGCRSIFDSYKPDPHINFDREAGYALQVICASDYLQKIAVGARQSLVDAVTNVAAIGISLNPAKKQAYLVPRKVGGRTQVILDISYRGLVDLAIKDGGIKWAQAGIVHANDIFVPNGFDQPPLHKHEPFAPIAKRGPITGVFVVAKTSEGDYLTHTMRIERVWSIRDRSESYKSWKSDNSKACPWVSDEEEMIKKTCIKQASKSWPRTDNDRLTRAIHHLDTAVGEGFAADIDNGASAAPSGPAEYPQADFEKNLPSWRKLVEAGKRTPAEIIATVHSKAVLSEAQIRAIHNLQPIEAGAPA